MKNFVGLLNSPHVEVRMACGEVIAVILERGRILDENLMDSYMSDLIQLTCQLSKDSQKYRGKRERKAQRASFRDVLRYLEVSHIILVLIRKIYCNILYISRKIYRLKYKFDLGKKLWIWARGQWIYNMKNYVKLLAPESRHIWQRTNLFVISFSLDPNSCYRTVCLFKSNQNWNVTWLMQLPLKQEHCL